MASLGSVLGKCDPLSHNYTSIRFLEDDDGGGRREAMCTKCLDSRWFKVAPPPAPPGGTTPAPRPRAGVPLRTSPRTKETAAKRKSAPVPAQNLKGKRKGAADDHSDNEPSPPPSYKRTKVVNPQLECLRDVNLSAAKDPFPSQVPRARSHGDGASSNLCQGRASRNRGAISGSGSRTLRRGSRAVASSSRGSGSTNGNRSGDTARYSSSSSSNSSSSSSSSNSTNISDGGGGDDLCSCVHVNTFLQSKTKSNFGFGLFHEHNQVRCW